MISIDFIKSNFSKGTLSIIAARPAMGKSSLAVSLALSLAQNGHRTLYFSVEMSEQQLVKRLKQQIGEEKYRLIDGMVYVDDTPRIQLSDMHNVLESLSVGFVVVDYLQLVSGDKNLGRTEELSQVVYTLKQFATEFDVPVVAISQLNRTSNYGDRPSLDNLKLPKDSLDGVDIMFIHRPEYYHIHEHYSNGKLIEGKVEFIKYHKQESSIVYLHFDKATTSMSLWLSWSRFREEILNSPNWIVRLDENDAKEFEDGGTENIRLFEAITEDMTEDRFNLLGKKIIQSVSPDAIGNACKIIIYIQFPLSFPIMMSEMNSIQDLIDSLIPKEKDCVITWGLSPREDNVSRIVCAIKG